MTVTVWMFYHSAGVVCWTLRCNLRLHFLSFGWTIWPPGRANSSCSSPPLRQSAASMAAASKPDQKGQPPRFLPLNGEPWRDERRECAVDGRICEDSRQEGWTRTSTSGNYTSPAALVMAVNSLKEFIMELSMKWKWSASSTPPLTGWNPDRALGHPI